MRNSESLPTRKTKSLLGVGTIPKGEQFFISNSNKNSNVSKGPSIPGKGTL